MFSFHIWYLNFEYKIIVRGNHVLVPRFTISWSLFTFSFCLSFIGLQEARESGFINRNDEVLDPVTPALAGYQLVVTEFSQLKYKKLSFFRSVFMSHFLKIEYMIYDSFQGSKGIIQWLINWCTSTIMIHKINPYVDYN